MEQYEFDAMLENWLNRQTKKQGDPALNGWAADAGLTDGTAGQAFVTRDEAVRMLRRSMEYFFNRIIAILKE